MFLSFEIIDRSSKLASDRVPKVFVSYSHDSLEHKRWVLELATRLRNNGIESIIDQWSLGPGDDLPHFMERNLSAADRVIMICTENYVQKANSGSGGVGYEKMIVTADLLKQIDSNKVIPIVRQKGLYRLPTFLQTKLYIDFSLDDQMEIGFDNLVRSIHGAPLYVAPPVSKNPFTPLSDTQVKKTGDGTLAVMKAIIAIFESRSDNLIPYESVLKRVAMSRIMADLYIEDAMRQDLVKWGGASRMYLVLEDRGRHYAIQNRLIGI